MLRFHFNCFSVCMITPPDPDFPADRDNRPQAELIGGFFSSRADAEEAIRKNEAVRKAEHEAWQRKYPWMSGCESWDYRPSHYEIISLRAVEFSDLQALEDAIQEAAVLRFSGVGREVAA